MVAQAETEDAGNNTTTLHPDNVVAADSHRVRIGLALGGGGARCAAHVGVLKVLEEEGIPIDLIAGTSMGAVVGGLYCAGVSTDELARRFEDASMLKEFTPMPLVARLCIEPIIIAPRLFCHPYDGIYRGVKFRNFINSLVKEPNREIANLPIPFAAICTNLVDGKSYCISTGNLGVALQASSAIPGLRKPVQIGDKLYCDGGLVCNVPVTDARKMGADFVIAVNVDEHLDEVPINTFRAAGSVSQQALRIQLATIDPPLCKEADIVIHPITNGINIISRKSGDGHKGVEAGVAAARAAMPEIKRKLALMGWRNQSRSYVLSGNANTLPVVNTQSPTP